MKVGRVFRKSPACLALLSLLAIVLLAGPRFSSADGGGTATLGISPPSVSLGQLQPGETKSFTIVVLNEGDTPINVDVSLLDFARDENGKLTFLEPGGDYYFAMSSWIRISGESTFSVAPSEQRKVDFVLTVPQYFEPGEKSCAACFSTTQGGQGNVVIINQVLSQILAFAGSNPRISGTGEIQSLQKQGLFSSHFKYTILVKNTGNTHLELDDVGLCFYRYGKIVHQENVPGFLLLPDIPGQSPGYRIIEGETSLPASWAGYEVRLEIPSLQARSEPMQVGVFPLWVLLVFIIGGLVILFVLAVGLIWSWNHRRKKRFKVGT